MSNITFEGLPNAVASIHQQLEEIRNLLLSKNLEENKPQDDLLTVKDAATFLSLSVPTVYNLISKGELPVMKRSKRCYFSKLELVQYLKAGRKKTNSELEVIAEKHLSKTR